MERNGNNVKYLGDHQTGLKNDLNKGTEGDKKVSQILLVSRFMT